MGEVYIQLINTNLALETSTNDEVKGNTFTGSDTQLWYLQSKVDGTYIIKNKSNGLVLDIKDGAQFDGVMITYPEHGEPNQVFYINQDKTIGSVASQSLVVAFKEEAPASGAQLYSVVKTGANNQKFDIIPYTKTAAK